MKKKSFNLHFILMIVASMITLSTSCKKCKNENNIIQDNETLKRLYYIYSDGAIDECKLNGQVVYCGEYNNEYDGARYVYEKDGKLIGACTYRSPRTDSICLLIRDCETIYRVKDNFWGLPAVDKYGLGK